MTRHFILNKLLHLVKLLKSLYLNAAAFCYRNIHVLPDGAETAHDLERSQQRPDLFRSLSHFFGTAKCRVCSYFHQRNAEAVKTVFNNVALAHRGRAVLLKVYCLYGKPAAGKLDKSASRYQCCPLKTCHSRSVNDRLSHYMYLVYDVGVQKFCQLY